MGFVEAPQHVGMDAPTVEPEDLSAIMLALMRIEGKVNSIISLLESNGQDED